MKEITQIENYQVEIRRRAYQRSMNLSVRPDGQLRVTCCRRMPLGEITRFVTESERFIQKRLLEIDSWRKKYPPREMISGEKFWFLGEERVLDVVWSWNVRSKVSVSESSLEILAPLTSTTEERRQALHRFFRRQAQVHLLERVKHFAPIMKLYPRTLSIRGQRTRWGSCTANEGLNLNWKLLAAPPSSIDYVVIHEIAHLRFMDHSKAFWNLVGQYHPDWKAARAWLKEHEYEIGIQFGF